MKNQKVELAITGMTCDHCATGIENRLLKTPGVRAAQASFADGRCKVEYDPEVTSEQAMADAVQHNTAYRVTGLKAADPVDQKADGTAPYDLLIIGGGSAAFSAAITAEGLGLRTLMVNGGLDFGGTCVNVGCVPSKNLIRAAETVHRASHSHFPGIKPKGADIDFAAVIRGKKELVATLQQEKYMDVVSDFQGLTLVKGTATLVSDRTIEVDRKQRYKGLKILIATGATTHVPAIEGLDKIAYLTTESLFDLEEKPAGLTILGAGYIGSEVAMAYVRLGVRVRMIEFTDRVMRTQTTDISAAIMEAMTDEGIEVLPNMRVQRVEMHGTNTVLHCVDAEGSAHQLVEPGKVLVATGIKPNTAGLGLEQVGVQLDRTGHVQVDAGMATNIPGIYAVGDVANTPPFVYTAAYEGRIAVQNAFTGQHTEADYTAMPWVIFTDPQVAGVGLDEAQAEAAGLPFEVSKLPMTAVPRALAAQDTRGFIKLFRHTGTDHLLGARVVAPEGGELIQLLSMAMTHGITVAQLAQSMYPYLTLSESIKLAAISFGKDVSKLSCCAS
ncbi:MAG: mercury(II) reductase [Flavobacteriales bacterium]|nr:mercury(II) reductase [Flavobacteriales bacterium]